MSDRDQGSQPSNPTLERLDLLVGEWNIKITSMSFLADKTAVAHGRTSFHWIERAAFLLQHSEVPSSDVPRSISIMGSDDKAGSSTLMKHIPGLRQTKYRGDSRNTLRKEVK